MADNLGTASVDITAELEPFHKGLQQARSDLQSSLSGMTDDVAKFDMDAGKLVQGLTDKFRNLISIFGVGFGIREIVATIEEGQNAAAQLGAAITATGGAAGFSQKQLVDYAKSLQATSTFSDTAIEKAEALALTFRNVTHDNVIPLISASMNIAAQRGEDLSSVVLQLGRALNDPVREMGMLSREGISLDGSQQALIKHLQETGQQGKAQAMILADVEASYGGAASAARDTLGGALDALGHNVEDLVTDLGEGGLGNALKQDAQNMVVFTAGLEGAARASGAVAGGLLEIISDTLSLNGLLRTATFGALGGPGALSPAGLYSDAVTRLNDILNAEGPGKSMPLHRPGSGGDDAESQKLIDSINLQAAAYQRLAEAVGKGTDAQREAIVANDQAEEVAKLAQADTEKGTMLTDAETAAVRRAVAARDAMKFSEQDATALNAINLQTAAYQREADAIGKGVDAMRAAQIANDIAGAQSKFGGNPASLEAAITARDKEKFAIDDEKASLEAYDREQQKSNELIQQAIDAADGSSGKLKTVLDQYEALAIAIQDQDVPAMMQMDTALTGMNEELNNSAALADKANKALAQALSQGASSIFGDIMNAGGSLMNPDSSSKGHSTSYRKFGEFNRDVSQANTAMATFEKLGMDVAKTIEKMIVDLTIVNPLLNAMQQAITGNPGTRPSLFGAAKSGAPGATPQSSSPISSMLSGGASDVTGFIKSLISSPNGSPDPTSFSNFVSSIMSNSELTGLLGGGAAGGGIDSLLSFLGISGGDAGALGAGLGAGGADAGGMLDIASLFLGFASGGSFDVGGNGGTDSQLVAFKATPGEHVQVGQNPPPAGGGSTTNVHVVNNSGASATVTKKKNSQGGHDVMVQIGEAMASDVANGGPLGRSITQNLSANRVPISR